MSLTANTPRLWLLAYLPTLVRGFSAAARSRACQNTML